jgi:hypothetical protein
MTTKTPMPRTPLLGIAVEQAPSPQNPVEDCTIPTRSTAMTTTSHQPEHGNLLEGVAPETVAILDGIEALSGSPIPGSLATPDSPPAWNCLEHVPAASFASFVAECLRFGGRRRRQEAARAAYDARWMAGSRRGW